MIQTDYQMRIDVYPYKAFIVWTHNCMNRNSEEKGEEGRGDEEENK
jgi:hypothetical protein